MELLEQIDLENVPQHVAIIMDGNGRWAKKQGEERIVGHSHGADSVRATLKAAKKIGVKYLTYYAFSTENWSRPQDEIDGIMKLLVHFIANETPELKSSGVRLRAIGDLSRLPIECQEELALGMAETAENEELQLILALNYSGRWDLTHTMQNLAKEVASGALDSKSIDIELIQQRLSTGEYPDPELLIRTSGEQRISNFLLWQTAYSEFYFTPVLWPDFNEDEFNKAIIEYQARERRFGLVSEQL